MRFLTAAAAAAFLIVGFALRPDAPTPPQQERPGPLLQQVVQQREAESVLRALQGVGAATVQYGALVTGEAVLDAWSDWEPALAAPPDVTRYGVVVAGDRVVTYARGLSAQAPVQVSVGDGRQLSGRLAGPVSAAGLAPIAVEPSAPLVAPPRAGTLPRPGDSVVAAAPAPGGRLIAPLFVAAVHGDSIVATTPLEPFLGAPVFSVARELVGVVAMRDGVARIVTMESALRDQTEPVPPAAPIGVTLEETRTAADTPPVVAVRALDPGGRAAAAGLRTGDIVEAIDDVAISDLQHSLDLLSPGRADAVALRVRRRTRVLPIIIPPVSGQP